MISLVLGRSVAAGVGLGVMVGLTVGLIVGCGVLVGLLLGIAEGVGEGEVEGLMVEAMVGLGVGELVAVGEGLVVEGVFSMVADSTVCWSSVGDGWGDALVVAGSVDSSGTGEISSDDSDCLATCVIYRVSAINSSSIMGIRVPFLRWIA